LIQKSLSNAETLILNADFLDISATQIYTFGKYRRDIFWRRWFPYPLQTVEEIRKALRGLLRAVEENTNAVVSGAERRRDREPFPTKSGFPNPSIA
jgi:hypothetical protein